MLSTNINTVSPLAVLNYDMDKYSKYKANSLTFNNIVVENFLLWRPRIKPELESRVSAAIQYDGHMQTGVEKL